MEKYSFEKAQDEADKMKTKVESGVAENYSEAEILQKIETHTMELTSIASVFDINIEEFSDEQDLKFADDVERKNKLIQLYCEKTGINYNLLWKSSATFRLEDGESVQIESQFFDQHMCNQAESIRKNGRIINSNADNANALMERASNFAFTQDEQSSLFKMIEIRNDARSQLEENLIINQIKKISKEDDAIGKFIKYVNDAIPQSQWTLNELKYYISTWEDEHAQYVKTKFDEIVNMPKNEEIEKLATLHGRIFVKIDNIFYQRMAYIAERAKAGDENIKDVSEGKFIQYKINKNFKFTEDDARKAEQLNLPWSKYEKEIAE